MSTTAVAISTETGEVTPFSFDVSKPLTPTQLAAFSDKIKSAQNAKVEDFTDVTSIYWEAKRGETKVLAFKEWKVAAKKDAAGVEIGKKLLAVFFDGARDIVMAQTAIVDSMKPANFGDVFKITCTEATALKAKRFDVLRFDDVQTV